MRGIWFENQQFIIRDDLPMPCVQSDAEVLIKILQAGICSTDHHLFEGMYDFHGVPGHEFIGQVKSTHSDLFNQRVVGKISTHCHHCSMCHRHRYQHCENRKVLGIRGLQGAFAEYIVLPRENVFAVPESINNELATFSEPLAAALRLRQQIHFNPDDHVLIIGPGKLGQLICRCLMPDYPNISVLGRGLSKLSRLPSQITQRYQIDNLPDKYFDLIVECSGSTAGLNIAVDRVRPQGTIILKSTMNGVNSSSSDRSSERAWTNMMTAIVTKEIHLIGSRCGDMNSALACLSAFPDALTNDQSRSPHSIAIQQSAFNDMHSLIDGRYPLDAFANAFTQSQRGDCLKVVLTIGDTMKPDTV